MPKAIMIRDPFILRLINAERQNRFPGGKGSGSKVAGMLIHEAIAQARPELLKQTGHGRKAK